MNFFIDIENLLLKKRVSFYHFMLICIFIVAILLLLISCISNGNFFPIIVIFISIFVCIAFFNETKKLYKKNQLIEFQKNVATDSFDTAIFAFFVFSDSRKCVFVNRVAQNLLPGFKIRTMEDFIVCFGKYPKIVSAIRELETYAKNLKQHHIDVPINLNSGTTVWRIAVSPLMKQKGFYCWTIIDLTPSSTKIDSLEMNSSFLMDIINGSNVGYFCLDARAEIVFCNNTLAYWLGITAGEAIGTNFDSYIIADESDDIINDKTEIQLIESAPLKIKLKTNITDGIEIIAKQIFRNDTGLRGFIVSKEAQQSGDLIQALEKTKLYFEHIFEDAPLGILITDGAEAISACNRTFKNIVGTDTVDKESFLNFVCDEDRENTREKLYKLISGIHQSIMPFEIQFKAKIPKTAMVYVSKIEEHKRTKSNDGLVMYFLDITERKELQQQFVQSQKMQAVGQLAGGIAHDFNNLLTAMIGYCDLLLEKYLPSDQSFNDVMQIKQNANRASNLVRQLLAFSRQQTLQPKILSVIDMIGELSSLLKRLLGAKIDLKVSHGRDVGFIKVDQIQFEQVIINLSVNARDAMKDGGILNIKTSKYKTTEPKFLKGDTMPPGEYILIEVEDNGGGIADKYLNRIFDPFFSTKEKGSGTGLGLSTVYGIVNQTGGFISVESELNVGTKFYLYFPEAVSDEITQQNTNAINNQENKLVDLTGSGTILLVEDEDAVRMFSARALREKGYHVIEASNGESALEFVKKESNNIDVVITDVVMPKMDGPTLVEHIKKYNPKLKVIFISGYTEDNFRESVANDHKVHFLSKPFNLKELANKVKETIG